MYLCCGDFIFYHSEFLTKAVNNWLYMCSYRPYCSPLRKLSDQLSSAFKAYVLHVFAFFVQEGNDEDSTMQ